MPLILVAKSLQQQQIRSSVVLMLFLLSIGIYEVILQTGNSFQLGDWVAWQPLLEYISPSASYHPGIRLITVISTWILRCLPYLFGAILVINWLPKTNFEKISKWHPTFLYLLFLIVNFSFMIGIAIPSGLREILLAYTFFLVGLSLSKQWSGNNITKQLGNCSFGIYLIHPLFIFLNEAFLNKLPQSFTGKMPYIFLSVLALSSFILSWISIMMLMKNKKISHYLFGT